MIQVDALAATLYLKWQGFPLRPWPARGCSEQVPDESSVSKTPTACWMKAMHRRIQKSAIDLQQSGSEDQLRADLARLVEKPALAVC